MEMQHGKCRGIKLVRIVVKIKFILFYQFKILGEMVI